MATDEAFIAYLRDQLTDVPALSIRKMFGEYAIYAGPKVVALACDNQLFVKPTNAGRALLGAPVEAPPYPGARPSFLIDAQLDDRGFMACLIRATEQELPLPRPGKKPKSRVG
jgi:TfoX/Sxy family transcriptional regulator of competence genes